MNIQGYNQDIDRGIDIFASFASVTGDAARQLVTKIVRHLRRCIRRALSYESLQRPDELLVVAPAGHGILVDPLPYLPGAGSDHLPLGRMELQHPWVPFETDEFQHFARPGLL